ncbi:MAG: hypothetical protein K6C97_11445 [Treponema sp.]|nr:hypothetical protein [Treponema sp.]
MLSYIAIFLSSIAIILMVVILIKFKKLFSTEKIIEKTKNQMNRVIIDVNNNANRDIELINEATKRTRALLNDADRKMDQFRQAGQLLDNKIALAENPHSNINHLGSRPVIIENEYKHHKNNYEENKAKIKNPYINPNDAYEIKKDPNQKSLFDEENTESVLNDVTKITNDGAAYKEVPLIITKIYDDKVNEQKRSNKQIDDKVEKLFRQGMNVDDIAAELSCSIAEVQFIIDML